MQLSVIIVNYNVKYFLEHCLKSVLAACTEIHAEILVVDNQSSDGSVKMVKEKFPNVVCIENKENVGFAKANNQAVAIAKGKYILYLNPDTIVPEDCFQKCIEFMDAHETVGSLGCRLVDGKGIFLPESKRGFPSAPVAFFKIAGLSNLFPKSKLFNRYHLGYLPEMETNEVDVLVGCFMFCRKAVIDKVGSFDEDYFMYGEDIDLSYKINQAGFQNIYFPETTVIHYKGESTKKGTLNYVKMFYKAMIIFAQKHFKSSQKGMFVFLIRLAIYFRAVIAFFTQVFSLIRLPLIDASLLFSSLAIMKIVWIRNVKINTFYSTQLLTTFFAIYVLIWIMSIFLNGGYDKPYKPIRVMRGMLIGGIISIALYGLLNEQIRFSRGITVLGALLGTLLILASRKVLQFLKVNSVDAEDISAQQVMIVGTTEEADEIQSLLDQAYVEKNIIGVLSPFTTKGDKELGIVKDASSLSKLYKASEIIYAQNALTFKQIIESIEQCGATLNYKIHCIGTDSIIGSNSKNTAGDLYSTELIYSITKVAAKRNKRVVDLLFASVFILLSPILIFFVKNKGIYLSNCLAIFFGTKTFIGYEDTKCPRLKPHVLSLYPAIPNYVIPLNNREHLNWLYAKNYNAWKDVEIILSKWREL